MESLSDGSEQAKASVGQDQPGHLTGEFGLQPPELALLREDRVKVQDAQREKARKDVEIPGSAQVPFG